MLLEHGKRGLHVLYRRRRYADLLVQTSQALFMQYCLLWHDVSHATSTAAVDRMMECSREGVAICRLVSVGQE